MIFQLSLGDIHVYWWITVFSAVTVPSFTWERKSKRTFLIRTNSFRDLETSLGDQNNDKKMRDGYTWLNRDRIQLWITQVAASKKCVVYTIGGGMIIILFYCTFKRVIPSIVCVHKWQIFSGCYRVFRNQRACKFGS